MEFFCIATAHFLALLSPGPDFFLIMQASLRMPYRYGIAVCSGIASANGVYLVIAVLGLNMIKDVDWLMSSLKYLGSGYLVYLGVLLLKAPKRSIECQNTEGILHKEHLGSQFLLGFLSGIFNPKNMIFYLSLFTVMVSDQTPIFMRWLYAVWMVSIVFIWDCAVVLVIGKKKVKNLLGRSIYYIEKCTGVLLAFFGLTLIVS